MIPDLLVPARRRGHEHLDDPSTPEALRHRSIREIARSNFLFGGTRAAIGALDRIFLRARAERADPRVPPPLTLLDVGTGAGDIPAAARRRAARHGVQLTTIGLDRSAALAAAGGARSGIPLCADALALPFASGSIDVVLASQLLHHFEARDAGRVLAELHRVARLAVVVADLRRSRVAAAGFWLASFPLGFHRITREDGVTSVFRGFTEGELRAMIAETVGAEADVRRRLGWRLVASWRRVP